MPVWARFFRAVPWTPGYISIGFLCSRRYILSSTDPFFACVRNLSLPAGPREKICRAEEGSTVRKLCLLLLLFFLTSLALREARSGCCSSHGGGLRLLLAATALRFQTFACRIIPTAVVGEAGVVVRSLRLRTLAGSAASSTACTLTWNDNSSGENYFYLEDREVHQSQFARLAQTVSGNTTAATIDHLASSRNFLRLSRQGSRRRHRLARFERNHDYDFSRPRDTLSAPRDLLQPVSIQYRRDVEDHRRPIGCWHGRTGCPTTLAISGSSIRATSRSYSRSSMPVP